MGKRQDKAAQMTAAKDKPAIMKLMTMSTISTSDVSPFSMKRESKSGPSVTPSRRLDLITSSANSFRICKRRGGGGVGRREGGKEGRRARGRKGGREGRRERGKARGGAGGYAKTLSMGNEQSKDVLEVHARVGMCARVRARARERGGTDLAPSGDLSL